MSEETDKLNESNELRFKHLEQQLDELQGVVHGIKIEIQGGRSTATSTRGHHSSSPAIYISIGAVVAVIATIITGIYFLEDRFANKQEIKEIKKEIAEVKDDVKANREAIHKVSESVSVIEGKLDLLIRHLTKKE